MPVFATAYNTTAMDGHQVAANKLRTALQDSLYRGMLVGEEQIEGCWMVDNNYSVERNPVAAFGHPIDFEGYKGESDQANCVAADVRGFTRFDELQAERTIRMEAEYNLMKARLLLNRVWLTEEPEILFRLSNVPLSIFTEWIGQAVGRKYLLDGKQQLTLGIWAGFYYYGLFQTEAAPTDLERVRIVDILKKTLRADASDILKAIDGQSYPTNILDFCARAEEVVGNVRLRNLNFATLYQLIQGTWFGPGAKETLSVALEHPPTWIAICATAFSERSYQKSTIGRLTEMTSYRESGKMLIQGLHRILNY